MDKSDHREYLQSEWWQTRRREYLSEHSRCERCGVPRWLAVIAYDQDLNVHHRNYLTKGKERDQDLQAVCRRCHEIEHYGRSEYRAPKVATCEVCERKHFDVYSDLCEKCGGVLNRGSEAIVWAAETGDFFGGPLWHAALEVIEWTLAISSDDENFDSLEALSRYIEQRKVEREEGRKLFELLKPDAGPQE